MATAAMAIKGMDRLFGGGTLAGRGDAQLVEAFLADRDESAFAALVARHGPMVLATCRAVLRDPAAADDAFQATFLVLAKKASSVRGREALGGWLHRVAYRTAVQAAREAARRRDEERKAAEMRATLDTRDDLRDDLRAAIHAEVERLPEPLRLPVVLCDLEGRSREQAAEELRWSEWLVRGRLERGRKKLRHRLTLRGLAPAAGFGAATMAGESLAAVPETLAAVTVRAAVGSLAGKAVPAGVAGLAARTIRMMLAEKVRSGAIVAMAALGVAGTSAGVALVALPQERDGQRPAMKAKEGEPAGDGPAKAADAFAREARPGETIEVKGRVVGPKGEPVAGATVWPILVREVTPYPTATSGPDGRFAVRFPREFPGGRPPDVDDTTPWIFGSAPGYGIGWATGAFRPGEATVRLVEEGPAIEGRVVDLEGRPVAGAAVKVERLYFAPDGDIDRWLGRLKEGRSRGPWDGLDQLQRTPTLAVQAGPDGRFRVPGIGRDRIADLLISGPSIETIQALALARIGTAVHAVDRGMMTPRVIVIHPARFDMAAAPTKPIEGIIRDKDTGRPIAGVKVKGAVHVEHSLIPAPGVEATSDDQGRYRLAGLPKASAYSLYLSPGKGSPYPKVNLRVAAESPAFEPVHHDAGLKRGVLLRGRVTEKGTGKPAALGYVNVFAFRDNPHVKEFPGYVLNDVDYIQLDPDGRYETVALPGRGIIGCRSGSGHYRGSVGAEAIKGFDPKYRWFDTLPLNCYAANYHVLAELNIDPATESATVDLRVDPGRTVALDMIDPDGRPLGGTRATGIGDLFQSTGYDQPMPRVEVRALDPSKPRRVTVRHAGRKLIGSIYLKGDEAGPLTLRLQPWGTIVGRVVDDQGRPRKGMALGSAGGNRPGQPDVQGILPGGDTNAGILLGSDGRFRVEGLVPGLKYGGTAGERGIHIGELFEGVAVDPGEIKDLGDLLVIPPKREGQ